MSSGNFIGIDPTILESLRSKVVSAIECILTVGGSYEISGRKYTMANLSELRDLLGDIQDAIKIADGSKVSQTLADFRTCH